MKIALIGTPQSGKTATFLAVAGPQSPHVLADQKAHLAMIDFADERLDEMARSEHSKKITHIQFGLVDSPLLCANPDKGLNFTQVRDADAFAHVLHAYNDYEDPLKVFQNMESDFILKDLEIVDTAIKKVKGEVEKGRKEREKELPLLLKCQEPLHKEKPLRALAFTVEEEKLVRAFGFLSQKPLLLIVNISESDIGKEIKAAEQLTKGGFPWVAFSAKTEKELYELKEEERKEFMADLGIQESARDHLIRLAFEALGLISFFTVGEESKAWPLQKGKSVLEAAGRIHSDIARGFIRAEIYSYKDFTDHGSIQALKEKGRLRLEGKEYIVQDGDCLNIKFSV